MKKKLLQLIHWEYFSVIGGRLLPKRDNTRRCNVSWKVRLANPQKLFGVLGGVILTLINSRIIRWWGVIQEVRMIFAIRSVCWRQIWRVTGRESGSPELLESPRTSPEVFGDFPWSSLTVELNSNPEVPRKFPRLPRKFPGLPRKFPELPRRSAVSLGSLTP